MNKPHILFHLREAQTALGQLIHDMEADSSYEFGDFRVDMEHLYHHINSAWNGRDAAQAAVDACSREDFDRWRQFPTDIELVSEPTI